MGASGQHHAPAALYSREPVPIGHEAGWALEPVWTQRLEEKSSASVGDRTPVVQSVVIVVTEPPRLIHNVIIFAEKVDLHCTYQNYILTLNRV
jgi:hypothetical protein